MDFLNIISIIMSLNPQDIYFTHSKISSKFSGCGKLLEETLNDIIQGNILIDDIPKIKVFYIYHENKILYFSQNNRRLWIFKKLYNLGFIKNISVRLEKTNNKKFITNNFSKNAKIIF